ncbi:MAG TPA: DUF6088 family protein [Rhizomicrobium sp.]|jgi:hypothetical protein
MRGSTLDLKQAILDRMTGVDQVWTPADFLDLGAREAVDQALHRLAASKSIRRATRGFYDIPKINPLTKKPGVPDYRAIIDAIVRRDKVRIVLDGITAANDLGLTDAVPARVVVFSDARLQPIKLGNLVIQFKHAAPSKLFWAGRPAMRVVQALYWLKDMMSPNRDRYSVLDRLGRILNDPKYGTAIRSDLSDNISVLPGWMQQIVRELLSRTVPQSRQPPRAQQRTTAQSKRERKPA